MVIDQLFLLSALKYCRRESEKEAVFKCSKPGVMMKKKKNEEKKLQKWHP